MAAEHDHALEVRGLCVDIPTRRGILRAVTDVSFTVEKGETLCLVGESGCGKSMTAMAIMNLLPPLALRRVDTLKAAGTDLAAISERDMRGFRGNRMSMIFQEPMTALNPLFTIGDQIVEVLRQHRDVSHAEARKQAVELLRKVKLPDPELRLDQYPHEQSGGQRQRILIAMALICGPEVLVADEPTTALDATVQLQLLRLLKDLQRESGMGMVFITHDLGVVANIADKVAVMYGGRIVEFGSTSGMFRSPQHPYTAALINCLPTTGAKPRQPLRVINGAAMPVIGEADGCAYRSRCEHASAACEAITANAPRSLTRGHYARCVLLDEAAPGDVEAGTERALQ